MFLLSKAAFLRYIPDGRSTEISPFMVDGPDRGSCMSAITSQSSRLSFHLFNLHRWQLSQSLCSVFISGKRRFWGLFGLAFPPTSPSSFLLTQRSRTQAICQGVKLCLAARNIYPNIYISYYCLYITSVVICYLFSGNIHFSQSSLILKRVKTKHHNTFSFCLCLCFQGKVDLIRHLLILCLSGQQRRHLRG